jgi:hypothetical protein
MAGQYAGYSGQSPRGVSSVDMGRLRQNKPETGETRSGGCSATDEGKKENDNEID